MQELGHSAGIRSQCLKLGHSAGIRSHCKACLHTVPSFKRVGSCSTMVELGTNIPVTVGSQSWSHRTGINNHDVLIQRNNNI